VEEFTALSSEEMTERLSHGATAKQVDDYYGELYEKGGLCIEWAPPCESLFNQKPDPSKVREIMMAHGALVQESLPLDYVKVTSNPTT